MSGAAAQVLLLLGPTASGKTALAITLAQRRPVHLINMDSAQVYRGLDIGTAKPDAATLARYPHALIDIRDPTEPYSAADFIADADVQVRRALATGKLPVLVGGTMLYGRAFLEGLAELPQASPSARAEIAQRAAREGWPALHAELTRLDPDAARVIHPNNHQRLQRALEVLAVTGEPISGLWRSSKGQSAAQRLGVTPISVALIPQQRALLHAGIEQRFAAMLRAGLINEVQALRRDSSLHLGLPALRAVGYRQVWEGLAADQETALVQQRGVAATRQLAKRQLTWLRRWPDLIELIIDGLLSATDSQARDRALAGLCEELEACLAK